MTSTVPAPDNAPRKGMLPAVPLEKVISASELFGSDKEVCIEHAGVRYRLRITRRNRLILQK